MSFLEHLQAPKTFGQLAGWMGSAFLLGVVLHSVKPYQVISVFWLSLVMALAVVVLVFAFQYAWARCLALCVLALLLGVWRFDVARFEMPRGLVAFSSKGLAHGGEALTLGEPTSLRHWLVRSRLFLTERAQERFAPAEAALLSGILYGERGLPKDVKTQFRAAGLLHIVAVSGSNVTILVVIVMRSLLLFPVRRRTAFTVFTGALILFVAFVSPSASVVRAAIMGWLIELAPLLGRVPRPSRLLLVAAVLFPFWKPWSLLFDVGFALSFLAMWGLLTWGAWLNEWLRPRFSWAGMREILAATVGATLMTAPYSAWAFGQMTLLGLVASVVALPLIPWVMAFGMPALLAPLPFAFVAILLAQGFLQILLWIGRAATWSPIGSWSGLNISVWWMIGIYLVIWLIWREIGSRKTVIHSDEQKVVMSELFVGKL